MVPAQSKELVKEDSPNLLQAWVDGGVRLKRLGLQFSRNISFQQWEALGQQILTLSDSSVWWIADWLAYGEASFQERYVEATRQTSLKYQTLRNYAWVARRFGPSRRREALSFGHHAEVAALEEPEQEYWLRKAEVLGWSRNQLRREVRDSHVERGNGAAVPSSNGRHPMQQQDQTYHGQQTRGTAVKELSLKISDHQLEQFIAAARCRDLSLDSWAVQVLATAAQQMQAASE